MSRAPPAVAAAMARNKARQERSAATVEAQRKIFEAQAEEARKAELERIAEAEAAHASLPVASTTRAYAIRNKKGEIVFQGSTEAQAIAHNPSLAVEAQAAEARKSRGRPSLNLPVENTLYTIENADERRQRQKKATARDPCHALTGLGAQCKNKKFEGSLCRIHAGIASKPLRMISSVKDSEPTNTNVSAIIAPVVPIDLILNESAGDSTNAGTTAARIAGELNTA